MYSDYTAMIDREIIKCQPIEISDISATDCLNNIIRLQCLSTCFALGIIDTKKHSGYEIKES